MKTEHTNLASGYRYHGGNALILTQAMQANGWSEPLWATKAQAEKAERPLMEAGAAGVVVMLNERKFTVFNTAQLALRDEGEGYGPGHPQWESDQLDAARAPEDLYGPFIEGAEDLASAGVTQAPAFIPVIPCRAKLSTKPATLAEFRAAMPKDALSYYPREARAFFAGLPNGGTYTANMGIPRGELVYEALGFLAMHGDAEGRRYMLNEEQVGWVFYRAVNSKGKALKYPELTAVTEGLDLSAYSPENITRLKENGLLQPRYRLTLTPRVETQRKAA